MSKISSVDEFKLRYEAARPNSTTPLAVVARVSGSTVDVAVNTDKLHEPLHVAVQIDERDRKKALNTLFQIFAFVSQKAIDLGQKVLPIDLGISGFEVTKHPEFFAEHRMPPPQVTPGDHVQYLVNFELKEAMVKDKDHPKSRNMIDFKDLLHEALEQNHVNATINYQDEAGHRLHDVPDNSLTINLRVQNDTNALVSAVQSTLRDGDNVMTLVGGTGFNVGLARNYDTSKSAFESLSNLEIGASKSDTEYYSILDKEIRRDKLTPDWSFAAGHEDQEPQGIKAHLKFIRENIDDPNKTDLINEYIDEISTCDEESPVVTIDDMRSSPLLTEDSLADNKGIMQAARDEDKFALAVVNNLAFRWGAFLNYELGNHLQQGAGYTKLVITGSHILDMLLNVPQAKGIFTDSLFFGIRNKPDIVTVGKTDMDGMPELLKITAAQAAK